MKLNPDCIRDILFAIEELSKPNSLLTSEQLSKTKFLSKYSDEEILYHLQQLDWSGYIMTPNRHKTLDGIFIVNDLSPLGHEFISDIRKDTNWNKVKSISKEVGSETLSSIKTIAENVISTAITKSMGIN
jgi:hypothetical protein